MCRVMVLRENIVTTTKENLVFKRKKKPTHQKPQKNPSPNTLVKVNQTK